jgi:predicted nicotinamide N-methyase
VTRTLHTIAGDVPLHEYRLRRPGREWSLLHTGEVLTFEDEQRFLGERRDTLPYGVILWPAAIALAHDLTERADALRGKRVLELGAGTGLPGIVAASLGAHVVQTDKQEVALSVCRENGARNGVADIEYRTADWSQWDDAARYDFIVGSDILYGDAMHPHLKRIFETNLAPGGRVLIADPFRPFSLRLLDTLETDGWRVVFNRWTVGDEHEPRAIGVFELTAPA